MNATSNTEDASPMLFEQMENQTWIFLVQDTPSEERLVFHGFYTEEEAASVWNRRAERG